MANSRLGLRTRPGLIRNLTEGLASLDSDARLFIDAVGITNQTQINSINQLVIDLKSYNIWSKMKAVYPFIGGTADNHKWNLKDARDLDAAFRLVFSGGITHSSDGLLFNGTNGYGDTKLTPSTSLTASSGHLSIYSRTNVAQNSYDIGVTTSGSADNMVASRYGINVFYANYGALTYPSYANTDSRGHFITNRNSSTNTTGFINGVRVINTSQTGAVASKTLYIGCLNNDGTASNYSSRQLSFATIGDGLTDQEAADLYTSVQTYQTTLGRQV